MLHYHVLSNSSKATKASDVDEDGVLDYFVEIFRVGEHVNFSKQDDREPQAANGFRTGTRTYTQNGRRRELHTRLNSQHASIDIRVVEMQRQNQDYQDQKRHAHPPTVGRNTRAMNMNNYEIDQSLTSSAAVKEVKAEWPSGGTMVNENVDCADCVD